MVKRFKILEDIRGLRSVVAMSRNDGSLLYQSPSLDNKSCIRSVHRLWRVLESSPESPTHLAFNIENCFILAYFITEKVVLLHVDEDFDVVALHSKLRDIAAIAEEIPEKAPPSPPPKIKITPEKPVKPEPAPPKTKLSRPGDRPAELKDLKVLAEALQTIENTALEELGIFVAARALRSTRDELIPEYRCLYNFIVSKEGKVGIQGAPKFSCYEMSEAVAAWVIIFLLRCNEVVPAFPPEFARSLLDPMRDKLTEIGFLSAWDEAAALE